MAASIEPSAPPAPIMVWISSINKRTFPAVMASRITFLILSSNSPRYLVPATIPDRSRVRTRFPRTDSGTIPVAICSARPSTIAVLPTPGSPIRHGLFLVRRLRIWIRRWISRSLPITGSNSPRLASSVRSVENCLRVENSPPLPLAFA